MPLHRNTFRKVLLAASALAGAATMAMGSPALSQSREIQFDLAPQPLSAALREYGSAADQQLIFAESDVRSFTAPALRGSYTPDQGLDRLLAGTGLTAERTASGIVRIVSAQDPQGASADAGAGNDVDALIVTAQKREEAIQDVPIAISAFSQKSLEEQKIEGGFDLLKAIPNVTFSKSNFSSYNFSIRGVGTKAISATTDPGVAVAFNNTTLIQNRLFEQEYFDVERVEVLRGPQGTLYGRNATSGVINVITAKPDLNEFEASIKLEGGNYDSRRVVGMVNVPILEDVLAVRFAGAMTTRSGYDYNSITGNSINGRDLWSGRATVGFEPTDRLRANLLWEHFEEDDDRSRTGKQLCHRDPGLQTIDGTAVVQNPNSLRESLLRPAVFSQGCKPGSLYEDAAFGTPNGLALPFVLAPLYLNQPAFFPLGYGPAGAAAGDLITLLQLKDPYGGMMQSRDLRTVASLRDPTYRAKADLIELSVDFDIGDSLTLSSQTAYNEDEVYSAQDFNRFNTQPVFTDTSTIVSGELGFRDLSPRPAGSPIGTAGVFCDPQLGCSDTIVGFDISQAKGRQFSQELRLQSDFEGPLNFSVGTNYTNFKTLIDYYVFYNLITAYALTPPFNRPVASTGLDITRCGVGGFTQGLADLPAGDPAGLCPYIDPNPLESIDGEGHNYFRSKNPYELESRAVFGELYWEIAEDLKLTAGLRYTDDTKTFTPVPSQVLLAQGLYLGGAVNKGYPEKDPIVQQWGEWTGRIGLDWKPVLPFTDQTMLYGFYSRGYKGGGANPPSPGFASAAENYADILARSGSQITTDIFLGVFPILKLTAVEYKSTFEPEFVNAFEIGAKNTLLGGNMTFNATAFYYDYTDYQVSQIRDRTAVNENFDATIWGLEFETVFSPTRDLRINANLGYLNTKIADGETSIDIMNRTQGNPNYVLAKPWVQLPSNCVVPAAVAKASVMIDTGYYQLCGGLGGFLGGATPRIVDPATGLPYEVSLYPELNGGAGLKADLSGKELPNAPHWTSNLGVQYGRDIGSWRATLRGDAYWQSQSYARVYNSDPYDKLRGWYNVNLSVWFEQSDWGVRAELYAKNLLNDTPITDAFLNSDDTALTTNVFVLDPRVIGLSIRKEF